MAFRSLQYYNPYLTTVDPRIDSSKVINSNYCVLGVSQYPTFKEANKKGFANSISLLGLVSGYSINESIAISQFHEVGNKKSIIIPGKFRGGMNLSSSVFESVNLLGGIYETVLQGLNEKYGNVFKKPLTEELLFRPKLDKTYFNNPKNDGAMGGGVLTDEGQELANYYGIEEDFQDLNASGAVAERDATNKGAILLSIDDLRFRVRFGLCFIMFQSETRIPENSIGYGEFERTSAFGVTTAIDNPNLDFGTFGGGLDETHYRILAGQFYENCVITDYSRNINTDPLSPNISESVSLLYNGTAKVQRNMSETTGSITPIASE